MENNRVDLHCYLAQVYREESVKMGNRGDHPLYLTQEEALGLLDIVLTTATDLSREQRSALMKLSGLCRESFREDEIKKTFQLA